MFSMQDGEADVLNLKAACQNYLVLAVACYADDQKLRQMHGPAPVVPGVKHPLAGRELYGAGEQRLSSNNPPKYEKRLLSTT